MRKQRQLLISWSLLIISLLTLTNTYSNDRSLCIYDDMHHLSRGYHSPNNEEQMTLTIDDVVRDIKQHPVKPYTEEQVTGADQHSCYSQFNRDVNYSPVVFPSFNNYYQDITGGLSKLGNLTLLNGVRMFKPGENKTYPDFHFTWKVNNEFVSNVQDPTLLDLKLYSGVVRLRLDIIHKPTDTYYSREEWAYLGYNDIEEIPIFGAPSQDEVFVEFYPPVNPIEVYTYLPWDLDENGVINVSDLLTALAGIQ